MPNLITFGATEYMDGALNFSVLVELLFRGRPVRDQQRKSTSRARSWSPEDEEAQTPYAMSRRTDAQVRKALAREPYMNLPVVPGPSGPGPLWLH